MTTRKRFRNLESDGEQRDALPNGPIHVPVMADQVLQLLLPERGGVFVDCTVGLGGHAKALLEQGAGRLIGLDRDREALEIARGTLRSWTAQLELVHADYRELDAVLDERGVTNVNGVLADLGVSSMQLDAEGRGFSFRRDEPLDMRMDTSRGETAAEVLARADETELANAIYQFGEERHSRRIARAIVSSRSQRPIVTTGQLADIVRRASRTRTWQRIDPATRTFQALRIWVNQELEGLDGFLEQAARRLNRECRLAVITFHSLEDRIVKHTFRKLQSVRVLTKRPLVPSDDEIARNPRARSAKLRAVERT
jgi:16S rRNA (cytosine1402-N4)-methyltransferase